MATLNYNWQLIAEAGGSLNGNTCNVRIYAKINSQSVANNNSSVSYQSRLYYGGGYFYTGSTTTKSISGTGAGSSSQDGSGTYNGGETTLQTITGTVGHDGNGNANVGMSANFYASPWGYNVTVNGSASLPKINRVAVTNSVSGSDIEQNFSVNYTKYVNNYQYKLRISIPNVRTLETIDYNTSDTQFTLSQEAIEDLYSTYTNTNTFNLGFAVETWNGNSKLSSGNERIISCKITGNTPIFTDFDYADINSTTLALTGNSKYNINGYSTIRVTISTANKAVAQKGATMVKYQFMIGDTTKEVAYSDNSDVYIDIQNSSVGEYKVYAIDSRNNATLVTKLSQQNIDYTPLFLDRQNSYTERDDGGIGENVTLTYSGNMWNDSFGDVTNSITLAKYEFKETTQDDTHWVTGTTNITPTISNNTFNFNDLIRSNLADYKWSVNKSYNFRITLEDKLSTAVIELTPLPSGIPNISLNKNGVGIMCDYDENLGGLLQIGGEVYGGSSKVIGEYEVTGTTENTITINNISIKKDKTYLYKFVGSATVNGDTRVTFNDITSNSYYSVGHYYTGSGTNSDINLTLNAGYRPAKPYFYYSFHSSTNFMIIEGKIAIYKNLANNNYCPCMTWHTNNLWNGYQNKADVFGVLGVATEEITKMTLTLSTGYFRKGTKIQIIEENKFTIV